MGRSATNVIGNTVASAVVARWEGQITEPQVTEPKPQEG
jgi:Na+/H+-dicarboxylate symporter